MYCDWLIDFNGWKYFQCVQITSLPGSLCKLFKLKKLYVCENQLDFEGEIYSNHWSDLIDWLSGWLIYDIFFYLLLV